jgi:hypothetical protein
MLDEQQETPEIPDTKAITESWASFLSRRRLARMRLGQATAEYVNLLSDPEIRIALVPLTEAEFQESFTDAAKLNIGDNIAGVMVRERRARVQQVWHACRPTGDLGTYMFQTYEEFREALTTADIDMLVDVYEEMAHQLSPSLDGISPEELELLKKALAEMDWSGLSGRSWYAAKRFLSSISQEPPTASLPGSSSITKLTGTSENEKPIPIVSPSS